MIIRKPPLRQKARPQPARHQSLTIGQWKIAENEQGDLIVVNVQSGQEPVVLVRVNNGGQS